ncbi:hypothetical protein M9H77_12837 [Catharanthus roseus]|uniref:Uncharacterized protein n=1 Tax=Catharanthus roseus TaxID=4058 RepID=A0ACC0BIR7_CATRO|nr:hypothetical protein M9H77_12837 [Catharanthus roseus]
MSELGTPSKNLPDDRIRASEELLTPKSSGALDELPTPLAGRVLVELGSLTTFEFSYLLEFHQGGMYILLNAKNKNLHLRGIPLSSALRSSLAKGTTSLKKAP